MTPIDIPVLIAGGGPVGLLGAHLCERQGLGALVAERYSGRVGAPKAHALNSRSLEICHAVGLSIDEIHKVMTPPAEGAHVRFMTNLSGHEIGSLPYERQDEAVRAFTPWPLINIEQPKFENILETSLIGARHVRLQRELEWLGCDMLADSVVSHLRDHAAGKDIAIRSRYLIAADGAASRVREAAGIKMLGPDALAHNITIHFEADLRPVIAKKPAILYFLFGMGTGSVLIAYDIARTWVLMHAYNPATQSPGDFDLAKCEAIVREAIGAEVPFTIKGTSPWIMTAQVAGQYRSGNTFLTGDAAHRFPPSGGLGLNTGLADIENLVWKIAAVERGEASSALLDTYETERRQVAQTNTSQSVANAMRLRVLLQALGQDIGRDLDADALAGKLADPAKRAEIDAAVAYQKDHFDSLRLQLGYIYGEHRTIDDHLPISAFHPRAIPGAYLPHCGLAGAGSVLDLVSGSGLTLITGPAANVGTLVTDRTAEPVTPVTEGRDFTLAEGSWADRMGLSPEGAILVRPDRHILHVAPTFDEAARSAMGAAIEALLGPACITLTGAA
ncbi:MAG: hypothetical protein VR74_17945 [Hyphomonas sp. BRH_c22]|uniref:FAD-dependent monooxygenase n=1 Tax=Hyphomonas sp. BRH_c22 TaxID=1629710 RepID=UPI0005F19E57|nr:FAD-dependent monooxygenase [Hyphomonas sp. BRH_c22]KJS35046.1 MAG: hypothetical protein VR74_17945 [Hyphomonas sp. BRH_c22]